MAPLIFISYGQIVIDPRESCIPHAQQLTGI